MSSADADAAAERGTGRDGRSIRYAGQRERRREEFVDAALRAIEAIGPQVSVGEIAREAGVARTRIYRHFDDIADLQHAITSRAAELLLTELAPALSPHGSAREVISRIVRSYLGFLSEHEQLYRYTVQHLKHASSDSESYSAVRGAVSQQIATLFRAFAKAATISPALSEPLAYGLVGLVESTADHWLDRPDGLDRDELADALTGWAWLLISSTLTANGAELDPDEPLPALDFEDLD